jgi:quercetin 2,3-dioxygenase
MKGDNMSIKRKVARVEAPDEQPGFLGAGHMARPLIYKSFAESDPFILLMDDVLDKQDDSPAGGPHPHAGFETVSLLLEGEIGDSQHKMQTGDFQIMTAGSGVIHTETIDKKARLRLLQLWLNLPKSKRWTTPRVQDIRMQSVPQREGNGLHVRVYSGSFAGLVSPVKNHVPLIVADVTVGAGVSSVQTVPANFNTFLYVLSGSLSAGTNQQQIQRNEVAWLNIFSDDANSELQFTAGLEGARFVLYAAPPQGEPIVSYGPFIADTQEDIRRLYHEYNQGKMHHISSVPNSQKISW